MIPKEHREAVARAIWPLAEWNGDYQEALAAADAAIIASLHASGSGWDEVGSLVERSNISRFGRTVSISVVNEKEAGRLFNLLCDLTPTDSDTLVDGGKG